MKVAEVMLARCVWLFDLFELNPRGVATPPIHKGLVERYQFLRYPVQPEHFDQSKGLHYEDGTFLPNGVPLQVSLQIWRDGLVADTRSSTKDTQAFLEDLLNWAKLQFGLNYHSGLVKARAYESQLTVYPNLDLTKVCNALVNFSQKLSEFRPWDVAATQHLAALIFKTDHRSRYSFTFERREGVDFAENKFFSAAGLQTDQHIELLDHFERILSRGPRHEKAGHSENKNK